MEELSIGKVSKSNIIGSLQKTTSLQAKDILPQFILTFSTLTQCLAWGEEFLADN